MFGYIQALKKIIIWQMLRRLDFDTGIILKMLYRSAWERIVVKSSSYIWKLQFFQPVWPIGVPRKICRCSVAENHWKIMLHFVAIFIGPLSVITNCQPILEVEPQNPEESPGSHITRRKTKEISCCEKKKTLKITALEVPSIRSQRRHCEVMWCPYASHCTSQLYLDFLSVISLYNIGLL